MINNLKLSAITKNFWLTLVILVVFCVTFLVYIQAEKQIHKAWVLRVQSYLVADELRKSSEDLTRMIQTYIVTGDAQYKKRYQQIMDIRDGKQSRQLLSNYIYWDLFLGDNAKMRAPEQNISLISLISQTEFTKPEFLKLSEVRTNSDALIHIELAAVKLVDSTVQIEHKNQIKASLMLSDAAYHQAKAKVMQPLSEFYQIIGHRTLDAFNHAKNVALILRIIVALLALLLAYMLWQAHQALVKTLGASLDEINAHFVKIGSGNLSCMIPVARGMENSVMAWLSEMQANLTQINIDNQAMGTRNLRQTQLYEALTQCNQAIVRCTSAEQLFSQICHDAVSFGGMKMAWVGLFNEETQLIKPVTAYGEGAECLDQVRISVDGNDKDGRGPSATAFRLNEASWCSDFSNYPETMILQEFSAKFGWGALAALPLNCGGKVIGTFNIYSCDDSIFDQAGKSLLLEMSADIDFALDKFQIDSQRMQFKDDLLESEACIKLVLENSIDAIINIDSNGSVIAWNTAASDIFGYSREYALGQVWSELVIPIRNREANNRSMQRLLENNKSNIVGRRIEMDALRSDGSEFPVEMSVVQIQHGSNVFFSAFIRDITERRESETKIQRLAHFDTLTGLPNRSLLHDHFEYALTLLKRDNGKLAVIFLDLDHFKDINDTLGHSVGDVLLKELAVRLKSLLRDEDTLSRLGGDEFILILPGTDALGAANVSKKLLKVMSESYHIPPYELSVTGSIGVALYPDDGADLEILSRKADTAMYRAKREGRNDYRFYTAQMQAKSVRDLQLMTALRYALQHQQLSLHYQPQLSMHDGRILGAEALLRWQHPELGDISPAEFIPLAEDSGLIISIGEWVLREAVQQAKKWMDAGQLPLIMAVNLSATQFRHPDLPDMVTRILDEVGLAAEFLELELTEGVAMNDPQDAIAMMDRLHALGIRMSIDDFGTGYSSLSYLKKFKVYKLKIDQSFVRDINTDPEDKAIVSAVISMARSLGLQTIAEGVETKEQISYLREQGCNEVQGYFYSKPVTAEQFEQYIKNT